jgi:uncharacterized protein (DUF2141 family)
MGQMKRRILKLGLAASLTLTLPAAPQAQGGSASLTVSITGLKSNKGLVRLALCPAGAGFPDCGAKAVKTASLPITGGTAQIVLTGLTPGTYAVSTFHDANSNGKLDTFGGIPREGFGFSGNPALKPRAPKFAECQIVVAGAVTTAIKMRHIL